MCWWKCYILIFSELITWLTHDVSVVTLMRSDDGCHHHNRLHYFKIDIKDLQSAKFRFLSVACHVIAYCGSVLIIMRKRRRLRALVCLRLAFCMLRSMRELADMLLVGKEWPASFLDNFNSHRCVQILVQYLSQASRWGAFIGTVSHQSFSMSEWTQLV